MYKKADGEGARAKLECVHVHVMNGLKEMYVDFETQFRLFFLGPNPPLLLPFDTHEAVHFH